MLKLLGVLVSLPLQPFSLSLVLVWKHVLSVFHCVQSLILELI